MLMVRKIVLSIIAVLAVCFVAFAQNLQVTGTENLPHPGVMFQGAGLADHAADGYGQTCGGNQQHNGVDIVSSGEVAVALRTDGHVQRQLIKSADELDNGGGNGQKRCTLQKVLLF